MQVFSFLKKFCRMVWPSFLGTVSVYTVVFGIIIAPATTTYPLPPR